MLILCFILGVSVTFNVILLFCMYKLKDKKEIEEATVSVEERNSFFS